MNILVTGGAGFIGSSLIDELLKDENNYIISIDNYDEFYSKDIKLSNQVNHFKYPNFEFHDINIQNIEKINFQHKIDCIVHLAAKAGVRPSVENPRDYFDNNLLGLLSLLEFAKKNQIKKIVFASSSSVYGINENIPWQENDMNLQPISPYASSKLACENLGFTYSHLYDIRFVGLRLFTVYGPRQRPDLAINKFISLVLQNKHVDVYGDGNTYRDYTFIDDVVAGFISAINYNKTNFELINIGNNTSVSLMNLLKEISSITNVPLKINFLNEQIGDVPKTYANINKAKLLLNYNPKIGIQSGLLKQINWLKQKYL